MIIHNYHTVFLITRQYGKILKHLVYLKSMFCEVLKPPTCWAFTWGTKNEKKMWQLKMMIMNLYPSIMAVYKLKGYLSPTNTVHRKILLLCTFFNSKAYIQFVFSDCNNWWLPRLQFKSPGDDRKIEPQVKRWKKVIVLLPSYLSYDDAVCAVSCFTSTHTRKEKRVFSTITHKWLAAWSSSSNRSSCRCCRMTAVAASPHSFCVIRPSMFSRLISTSGHAQIKPSE